MNDNIDKTKLFTEFPPVSTKDWEEKINMDLKGADYEKKLVWKTNEGISLKPYYRAEDLEKLEYLNGSPSEYPYIRGNNKDNNNWEIRQDIEESDPGKANKIAINAILKGAEVIGFNAKDVDDANDIKTLLNDIDLTKTSIYFVSASSFPVIYNLFFEEIKRQNIEGKNVKGGFNFDSISYFLLYGKFYASLDNNFIEATSLTNNIIENFPNFKSITINGQYFHNAGATIVQELAFSLASANEYLIKLLEKGITIDNITPHFQFVFAIGSNYFMEIAKLRAARLLWSKIVEQYKPVKEKSMMMDIHTVTSMWNKSVYDPNVNMLRTTTEAMSAAIGGCNSMTVNTFDSSFKKSDDFSERIARNTQLVLKAESYLDKVVDPGAGSYYIETITDSIADATWKLFLEIEEKNGFIKAIESGFVKEEIEKSCQKRDMDIAFRKQVILGVNQYPNLEEKMLDKIKPNSDLSKLSGLKQYRGAQAFETLRISTEAYISDGHKCPSVFLFNFGNVATSKARATFATNFFGCAGYEIIDNAKFKTIEEGTTAALKSNAEIIIFCSSDDEYAEFVPNACKIIKSENPDAIFIVAGNPTLIIEQLKQSGVSDFIHVRSNILATIEKYQQHFGII